MRASQVAVFGQLSRVVFDSRRKREYPCTPRTSFVRPSNGCAAGNAHREWKCHGGTAMVMKCEGLSTFQEL